MKTLFPAQRSSVDAHKKNLLWYNASLDTSVTGVGKTIISAAVAAELGMPVVVVCMKIVIPQWKRELAERGVKNVVVVSNYEKLRRGNSVFAKVGKRAFKWVGPPECLVIWDEVHKCAGAFTQNSAMLIAAVEGGCYNLMLSATACVSPPEMRAIGYALGLHSLQRAANGKPSWFSWMKDLGCRRDPWNNWKGGIPNKIKELGEYLYGKHCLRLSVADLPNAFTENHIITEPLEFASAKEIQKYYELLGVTPDIVETMIEREQIEDAGGEAPTSGHVLTEILRARQYAEIAKIPEIEAMAMDLREEGYSVAIFVNFKDSVTALLDVFHAKKIDVSVVVGGQDPDSRERHVQSFQNNLTRIIICNIAAGGVGVSLHDTHGDYPRVSLISPTFDYKSYRQVLGRIHRAGAKSPSLQRVLIAAGSVEESVMRALDKYHTKYNNLHRIQND